MTIQQFCDWLASTRMSQAFADANWFVPSVQSVHILCIALVVAMLARLNVGLLQPARTAPTLSEMANSYLPWVWWAIVVLLVTGALLTITEPGRELMNFAFRLKMIMVLTLVILTVIVQRALGRDPAYWASRRWLGGTLGVVNLALCIGIVVAGRLIAYV